MRFKRIFSILVVAICGLLMTGCWDSLDVNQKGLTTTVAVDKSDDEYELIVEIANIIPGEDEANGGGENYTTFSAKGESYVDARLTLDQQLDKPIFLGTVRMLLLTNSMVKDGIGEYLFRLRNLFEYRKALHLVTTSEKPADIFEIQADATSSAGHTIEDILIKLHKTGKTIEMSASYALEELSKSHICFLIPDISIADDVITLSGYTIIQRNFAIDIIPISQTKGINFIINDDTNYIYTVPFGEHQAIVDLKLKKRKIIADYTNDEIDFKADFEFSALVKYLSINDGFDRKQQQIVVENLRALVEEDITSAIRHSQQKYKADYLEFDDIFRIAYSNEYEKMDWYERYQDATIRVGTKVILDPGGEYDYDPDIKWKGDE